MLIGAYTMPAVLALMVREEEWWRPRPPARAQLLPINNRSFHSTPIATRYEKIFLSREKKLTYYCCG